MTRPFLWLGKRLAYIALAVIGAALVNRAAVPAGR